MIIEEFYENDFINSFKGSYTYKNNFSFKGLEALHNYLEDLYNDIEENYVLDFVTIYCEYTQYNNIDEYLEDYTTELSEKDFTNIKDFEKAVKKEIAENTILIIIDDESFIIQQY